MHSVGHAVFARADELRQTQKEKPAQMARKPPIHRTAQCHAITVKVIKVVNSVACCVQKTKKPASKLVIVP